MHDLKEVPSVRTGAKGAVFVVRGRLEAIEADAYIVPTDSAGHVEPTWINIIGTDDLGRVRQLSDVASGLDADGAVWLGVVADRPLVALNVGGGSRMNSVVGLTGRLSQALALLERELAVRPSTHRSRPLVAMPLIGVDRGALGAETVGLGRSDGFVAIDTEAVREEDRALALSWAASLQLDAIVTTDGDADRPLIADEQVLAPLRRVDRDRMFITGELTYLLFERAWALMGMDSLLMAVRTHPAALHQLLDAIADYDIRVFDRYLELGVDAISFSEDLGSQRALLISPRDLRTFFVPRYRRIFAHAVQAGVVVRFHSCGCVQDVVTDLAEAGATVLNPVQARANDLARVKADAVAARLALEGGVDSHLLTVGTPEQVRAETLRVLSLLAPGGGYIAGPDQAMPWPEANYHAMMATVETYGRYPLVLPKD